MTGKGWNSWIQLDMDVNVWKWMVRTEKAGNRLKQLEITGIGWEWQEKDDTNYQWQKIAGHCTKRLEITELGRKWLKWLTIYGSGWKWMVMDISGLNGRNLL